MPHLNFKKGQPIQVTGTKAHPSPRMGTFVATHATTKGYFLEVQFEGAAATKRFRPSRIRAARPTANYTELGVNYVITVRRDGDAPHSYVATGDLATLQDTAYDAGALGVTAIARP